ncbi:MAG TPA: hypothetical protein DEO40_07040 [Treponema sp.]|nr:hypothetical protein [Treponema sp.]
MLNSVASNHVQHDTASFGMTPHVIPCLLLLSFRTCCYRHPELDSGSPLNEMLNEKEFTLK